MLLIATSGGQLAALVLGGALLVLSIGLFAIGVWSHRWPKTRGLIRVSIRDREWKTEVEGTSVTAQKEDKFYLAYSFEVNGCEYLCSSIRPNGDVVSGSAAERARWYPEGKEVDVYYCPFRPKWSCLEPGGLLMPIAVLFASLMVLFTGEFQ